MFSRGARKKLVAVIPLLLAVVACGGEVSDSQSEPVDKQQVAITPHRFDLVSSDPDEHGERLSAVLGCIGCHKLDLTGEDWTDPEFGVLWTANLTQSAAAYSDADLIAMIAEGRRPDRALVDMPSYLFSELDPDDLAALVGYLKTLPVEGEQHPDPTIGPKLAKEIASGNFKDSVQQVAEMRYKPPPSLMIVGAYSAEDFSALMKAGKPIGDRELKVMGGVSRGRYSRFTDGEIKAVYDYLAAFARGGP